MQIVSALDCPLPNKSLHVLVITHQISKDTLFTEIKRGNQILMLSIGSDVTVLGTAGEQNFILPKKTALIQINQPYIVTFSHYCNTIFFH